MFFRAPLTLLIGIAALLAPLSAHADTSLSVSITPPLFQLSIVPGQTWRSSVKIVNNNQIPVTYYAHAVDFAASDESGNAQYIPLVDEASDPERATYSLASWIDLPMPSVTIAAGSSADIPFTVSVPSNAEPGGHYAAILVGTQPAAPGEPGTLVNVSSYVSSLLLVQVGGNVVESGRIIEFSTSQELYQSPQADFALRFENTGNTHVKPQGNIVIYNMWGKQRGEVAINEDSGNFGNVLPKSIRKFDFSWHGDNDPFDIGLYSAVVTLSYGDDEKQSVSATTYFWVVPVIPVAIGLTILALFVFLASWFIRRYIRHALSLERVRLEASGAVLPAQEPAIEYTAEVFMEPIREGVIDLRALAGGRAAAQSPDSPEYGKTEQTSTAKRLNMLSFAWKYRLLALFLVSLIVGGFFVARFLSNVLVPQRDFQIKNVQINEEDPSQLDSNTN